MVNKKAVIVATIIIVIIVGAIVAFKINESKNVTGDFIESNTTKTEQTSNGENFQNSTGKYAENTDDNTINDVEDDNATNTSIEEEDNEKTLENNVVNENTISSSETEIENDEEKALRLAREKWGKNDNNVYYYVEEVLDTDVYIISVRDKATTMSLADYKVDIASEKVSEY